MTSPSGMSSPAALSRLVRQRIRLRRDSKVARPVTAPDTEEGEAGRRPCWGGSGPWRHPQSPQLGRERRGAGAP
eukprot:15448974-Alexandrium_andersonii.AAC.1